MDSEETIELEGTIYFDPKDVTRKHKKQASWKRMAIVKFDENLGYDSDGNPIKGITEYYSWFIKKRFNIHLTKPLRGAHISFINDSSRDTNGKWEEVKKKYHKTKVTIVLDVRPHAVGRSKESPSGHWWLIVPHSERNDLQAIRNELGLSRPRFGMHMTIGSVVDKRSDVKNDAGATNAKLMNQEQSEYIIDLIDKGFIKF